MRKFFKQLSRKQKIGILLICPIALMFFVSLIVALYILFTTSILGFILILSVLLAVVGIYLIIDYEGLHI